MAGTNWDHLNYRRFDHIEDSSEDEGDCHPNIDLGSWKRMKKRMRDEKGLPPREVELYDAYNVTKTNKYKSDADEKPTAQQVEEFMKNNQDLLNKYLYIPNDKDADKFLIDNPAIVTESGKGYCITKAVDVSCEGGDAIDEIVPLLAKRTLTVHNILMAASDAKIPTAKAVELFFERQKTEQVAEIYLREFKKQHDDLIELIKNRTKERLKEAEEKAAQEMKEMSLEDAEQQKAPLGPGGLDPTEVLNELPIAMKEAFVEKDTAKLQQTLMEMDPQEAARIMKRCVDSGLWVPGPSSDDEDDTPAAGEADKKSDDPEFSAQ